MPGNTITTGVRFSEDIPDSLKRACPVDVLGNRLSAGDTGKKEEREKRERLKTRQGRSGRKGGADGSHHEV